MSSINKISLYFLLLLFVSCQEKKIKAIENSTQDSIEVFNEYPEEENIELQENVFELIPYEGKIELAEKVFDISPSVFLQSCKIIVDGCDCCEGRIVFIDDNIFIEEFYCMPYDNFYIGYYTIFENNIRLYYETNYVSYGPEDDQDYNGVDIYTVNEFNKNESVTINLYAFSCNENLLIKSDESVYEESKNITTAELLETYSMSEFWDILKVTEIIENFYK